MKDDARRPLGELHRELARKDEIGSRAKEQLRAQATTPSPSPRGHVTTEALEALYATGHWLHSRRRYKDAAAVFRVMVLCSPDDERGYLALGSCHEGLGQEAIALEIYGAAILGAPPAARCHVARARVLRANGHEDEAEEALDDADAIAEAIGDEHLRAIVAIERRPR